MKRDPVYPSESNLFAQNKISENRHHPKVHSNKNLSALVNEEKPAGKMRLHLMLRNYQVESIFTG